jgi:Flp pilus assembly protein TadD
VTAGAAVLRPGHLTAAGAIAAPFAPLQQLMRLRPARFDEAQRAQADPEAARTEAGQLLEQGRVLVQRGQIEGAIGALRAAQRLDPANAAIPRALGLFYLRGGMLAEAMTALQEAIALAPGVGEAHYHLGVAHELAGND